MNDILVIIPLHKFDDEVKSLLNDAVNSVPNDIDIVISTQKDITEKIAECFKENPNVKAIGNDASDFQTLVNNAVMMTTNGFQYWNMMMNTLQFGFKMLENT